MNILLKFHSKPLFNFNIPSEWKLKKKKCCVAWFGKQFNRFYLIFCFKEVNIETKYAIRNIKYHNYKLKYSTGFSIPEFYINGIVKDPFYILYCLFVCCHIHNAYLITYPRNNWTIKRCSFQLPVIIWSKRPQRILIYI